MIEVPIIFFQFLFCLIPSYLYHDSYPNSVVLPIWVILCRYSYYSFVLGTKNEMSSSVSAEVALPLFNLLSHAVIALLSQTASQNYAL